MDVLVHCPDTVKLTTELRDRYPERLNEDLPGGAEAYLKSVEERFTDSDGEFTHSPEYKDAVNKAWRVARKEGVVISKFLIEKTPTKRNGDETLSLVRADSATMEMLDSLKSVTVLGTYEEVLVDKKLKAIHDRVYPRKPVKYKDEDGKERTHTPPERIGAFA